MLSLLVLANVLGHAGLYMLVYRKLKKTRFYRDLLRLQEKARHLPAQPRSKRDLRRIRKHRPYLKALRGKVTKLLALNVVLFMTIYLSILFSTTYISVFLGKWFVETPVLIPLLTGVVRENSAVRMYVHAYVVMLLSMVLVVYPLTRESKLSS